MNDYKRTSKGILRTEYASNFFVPQLMYLKRNVLFSALKYYAISLQH
jgi:hypothetical protein